MSRGHHGGSGGSGSGGSSYGGSGNNKKSKSSSRHQKHGSGGGGGGNGDSNDWFDTASSTDEYSLFDDLLPPLLVKLIIVTSVSSLLVSLFLGMSLASSSATSFIIQPVPLMMEEQPCPRCASVAAAAAAAAAAAGTANHYVPYPVAASRGATGQGEDAGSVTTTCASSSSASSPPKLSAISRQPQLGASSVSASVPDDSEYAQQISNFVDGGVAILNGVAAAAAAATTAPPPPAGLGAAVVSAGSVPYQHVTTIDTDILAHNVVNGPPEIILHTGPQAHKTTLSEFLSEVDAAAAAAASSSSSSSPYSYAYSNTGAARADKRDKWDHTSTAYQDGNNDAFYDYYYDSASHAFVRVPSRHITPPTPRKVYPSLCSDGYTYGYSDWSTLRAAVMEANALSAESFLRWNEYYAALDEYEKYYGSHAAAGGGGGGGTATTTNINNNDDTGRLGFESQTKTTTTTATTPPPPPIPPNEYYDDPTYAIETTFYICPGVTMRMRNNRLGPIYINTEDVLIECDDCVIDVGGTHFAFGPHAKNAVIRGITFTGAHSSSLTFHHHGAEASFEDCYWIGNAGTGSAGAVADLNSTSSVSFYRCEISDTKQVPRTGHGGQPGLASSLTIRN